MACRWLKGYSKQNKQCQNRRGFSKVLQKARKLAVDHCEEQFRYDRWNCSYKKSMFQRVFRETAFMYALSASAVMFTTAQACSEGVLQKCYCAEQARHQRKDNWQWGGCGDNTKKARKIAKRFLNLQYEDRASDVLNHNTNVGFNAVKESEKKICVCHGVSGSCVLKTCWKEVRDFSNIAQRLKQKYSNATYVDIGNQVNSTRKIVNSPNELLYLSYGPLFCDTTVGRRCKDAANCATLCCGRGPITQTVLVTKRCRYRWDERHYNVTFSYCQENEEHYY
ncbi:PREDICTED: protein Wnt-4, partial [Nicrophorus vespilloides]|uniref:Protein Wnt n=1 Tax=Nicrophorus vespilloides TaxID=110193 RepID=A0ABM1MTH4_NICVS